MNVLIAADMEGVAGIEGYGDCLPSHPAAYAAGRKLMTAEVLAAVAALRAGGAERISVGDWHMVGTNVERERMPAGVEVRPIAELALHVAEPSMAKAHGGPLDAVVFLGHHASTPNPRAFCSHTFVWEMEVLLDGESLNEVQVYAQALAAEGVPVLAASGDRWMLEELGPAELGGAILVPTKEGRGRARADSRSPEEVHGELSEAIAAAIAAPGTPPRTRRYPAELRVLAEGEELLATTVEGPDQLLTAIATTFRSSQVSREYRQLAKLLPAAEGSRLRPLHRRAGSILATPVMRAKERRWLAASPGSEAESPVETATRMR
ncbi:MAG: D-amino peptidase [Solirubrobacterales bacterium]|nr:D-amino peptidase [Solirubrobacterales bacterium]